MEQRFQLGALETPEDDPGLTLAGGTVYAVAPGGARTAVGGGSGAEFPPEWTVGDDGSLEIAPSGPTSTPLVLRGSASGSTLFGITDETGDVQMLRFDSDSMLTVSDENGYGGQFGASALGGTYIFPPPELTDPVLKVFDTDGNTAFAVEADGAVEINGAAISGNIFHVIAPNFNELLFDSDGNFTGPFFEFSGDGSSNFIIGDDTKIGHSISNFSIRTGFDAGESTLGFFGEPAQHQPTGVAVSAPGIHAALVTLGLITA